MSTFSARLLLSTCLAGFTVSSVYAQSEPTTTAAIEQEQAAVQAEITTGITNGTLSQQQLEALQARQQEIGNLQSAQTAPGLSPTQQAAVGQAIQDETGKLYGQSRAATTGAGTNGSLFNQTGTTQTGPASNTANQAAARPQTGPDPFTYNSLGPDAYAAQKYANPAYNVPSYPTTNPQPTGVQQQYSQPNDVSSAYSPTVGAYPPAVVNTNNGNNSGGNGVYTYHTGINRRD